MERGFMAQISKRHFAITRDFSEKIGNHTFEIGINTLRCFRFSCTPQNQHTYIPTN